MEDDPETETQNPNPNPEQTPNPAPNPNPDPPKPPEDAKPFFTASTEADLNAKLAPARTEARLALAKEHGYDTLSAFDSAMKSFKATEAKNMTELEKAQAERTSFETRATAAEARLNAITINEALHDQAKDLGLNLERLDAINELRPKNEGEVTDGVANKDLLKASLESVLLKFPEFKAKPSTVGTGTPPQAGAETATIDQQIATANAAGDWKTALRLQNQKLFQK